MILSPEAKRINLSMSHYLNNCTLTYKCSLLGSNIQLCPSGPSFCTKSVEEKLRSWSERQFRDALFNKTTEMAQDLDEKATQVDGESITLTRVIAENKMYYFRLHLCSSKQGSEGVSRHVHQDLWSDVPEECRGV